MTQRVAPPETSSGGATDSPASPSPRRPGRPRSAESEAAILRATIQLLAEQGYEEMSVEGVATRAGAGKATIYRRWPSKEALVSAALRSVVAPLPWPDTGSAREDILTAMSGILGRVTTTGIQYGQFARVISSLTGNPRLMAVYWERVVLPAREAMRRVLERGIARGEIRPDLEIETVLDMLPGAIFFRIITASVHKPPTREFLERVVDTLWRGFAADPTR